MQSIAQTGKDADRVVQEHQLRDADDQLRADFGIRFQVRIGPRVLSMCEADNAAQTDRLCSISASP